MKRPWMPLYPADYLADTGHLSVAEHGAYMLLIMHYWVNEGLPTDDRLLARIARMTPQQWKAARPAISGFFDEDWKHKRIEFELTEAARISAAGRAGGIASGEARKKRNVNAKGNDPPTTNERSLNDQPTISEALPSPSHPQVSSSLRSEETRAPPTAAAFEQFWQAYPNKVGKQDARKAFDKAIKSGSVTIEKMAAGLHAYVNKTDDRPWCNPATWLNQGRWDDQPAAGTGNGKSLLAAIDRTQQQLERQLAGDDNHSADQADLLSLPSR